MSDILVSAINYYYNHPVEFVEDIIGAKPTFQQAEIMRDLVEYRRVAVRSGRGIGKTGCESWLIMWFMWTRPYPKIPCTAPSQHQLFDILWSELYKWINQSKIKLYFEWTKTHLYNKQEPGNWFAVAQSCKDPSNMSGFHADHMMFLIDEAAGVAPEIMDIIEGSLTKKNSLCLLCGNPLKLSGFFHDAFHKDRDIWKCLHYSSIDSPLVDNTFVERMKKYGINSNVYRVNVLGEFPEQEDDTVISLTKIEEAVNRRVEIDYQREHEIHIGNDVARFGDDKTEIFVRLGNKIIENESHEKEDLMKTAGRMSAKILKYKDKYIVNANIDDTGLGCLRKGTEVFLVNRGWTKVEDIKIGDKIYSKDENNKVVIEKVKKNVYREETKILENKEYSFSFSHFLPYKTRKKYKYKLGTWDYVSKHEVWLDNSFEWEGKQFDLNLKEHKINMPNGGVRKYKKEQIIKGEIFAKFLGWFLSEGCVLKEGGIMISQSKKSKYLKDIRNVLDENNLKYYEKISNNGEISFILFNKQLEKWLIKNCYISKPYYSLTKKIPYILKMSNKKIINNFLNEFVKGDGYYHKEQRYYVSSSKQLAEDLLEMIYKVGKYGNLRIKAKKGSIGYIYGRKIIRTADNYYIYEFKNKNIIFNGKKTKVKENYEKVYDLKITGITKLFPCRFKDYRMFWVHNGGVTDRLNELYKDVPSVNVNGVNNGEKAYDSVNYANMGTELWFLMEEGLEEMQIPDNDELIAQLSTRRYFFESKGQRRLESKKDIKKRSLPSPDKADALSLTFFKRRRKGIFYVG